MKFGSVCSGIEAASVAWHPLGWKATWLSEIEPFPSAVLKHHYPDVPNLGDMTTLPERILSGEVDAPDVFCGGTPCQAFSVAGLRKSLDDARGNLSLTFVGIANAIDHVRSVRSDAPAIVFWENVPGVLSTSDNAFGCFLGALAGEDEPIIPSGGKWTNAGCVFGPQRAVAWRVLDAQYFGVAQRRRRVFVVASAREGFDPASILFEFDGVRRDTAPSREARKEVTECAGTLTANGGGLNRPAGNANELDFCITQPYPSAKCITARAGNGGGFDLETETPVIANTIAARTNDAIDVQSGTFIPMAFAQNSRNELRLEGGDGSRTGALSTGGGKPGQGVPMIAQPAGCLTPELPQRVRVHGTGGTSPTLSAEHGRGHGVPTVLSSMAVRRLTPVECERLQGFPDNYTNIPWRNKPESPDGPRYKALGNSWAVPVVAWIGRRIQEAMA
jgi:DNA (cytosine-5)-methyltransferase 1